MNPKDSKEYKDWFEKGNRDLGSAKGPEINNLSISHSSSYQLHI